MIDLFGIKNSKNHGVVVLLAFLGLTILTPACIDSIDIELEEGQEFLVVDGDFTPESRPHQVKLYYTFSQRTRDQRLVENAQLSLVEENSTKENYKEVSPGIYQLEGHTIQGIVGNSYHLEIVLPDGNSYRSRPAIMPSFIKGDSVHFDYEVRPVETPVGSIPRFFIDVFVSTPLPQDGRDFWIKWDVHSLYSFPEITCGPFSVPKICIIPGEPNAQKITILNGENLEADYLPKWKISEKRLTNSDEEFRGKHYFLVNQQSITRENYDYWENVNRIANQSGSIFDPPPAAVPGNIFNVNDKKEMVLGYFEVANVDSLRGFLTEGDFFDFYKFVDNVCPSPENPFVRRGRVCCNCLLIENSTLNRPDWF